MDILNLMQEDRKQRQEIVLANQQLARQFCEKHNLDRVELDFDGSGDSGMIDDVRYILKGGKEADLHKEPAKHIGVEYNYVKNKSTQTLVEKEGTANDLFEEVGYNALQARYSGWEINEGAFGTIFVNHDGSGRIEYNQRIESTEYSESDF